MHYSGIALYVNTFGAEFKGSVSAIWCFFVICLVGGAIFYCLGDNSKTGIIYVSYILLSLGGICDITILLAEIGIINNKKKKYIMDIFLICIPVGALGLFYENVITFILQHNFNS